MKNLEAKIIMAKNPEIVAGLKNWFSKKDKDNFCPKWIVKNEYGEYTKRSFTCDELCNVLWNDLLIGHKTQACPCLVGKTDVAEQFQDVLDLAKCIEVCGTPKPVQSETKERTYSIGDVFECLLESFFGDLYMIGKININGKIKYCLVALGTNEHWCALSTDKSDDIRMEEINEYHDRNTLRYVGHFNDITIKNGKLGKEEDEFSKVMDAKKVKEAFQKFYPFYKI
jgi:hypothetical protein